MKHLTPIITPARRNSSQHGKDVVRAIILATVSAGGAWLIATLIINLQQISN